ncbi:Acetyltransferase (GNAT) domain-containing protein [Tenacibaculum sp. MAR_2009_124]|uniref:GNAT family N-acetyltransferase n=1 Tax=Tenacibaculum sp. MAR_2009_124 TaxID=1250059 RepID=UPI0008994802|nr:GNAT family N-acetyltransferase [Tenacibaculum sp. MAR_2009_124]SEC86706.1 Acetyltransferase (GNAT) domain-containing protein [Tenacibaculum sp. MAR_2009_124]
MIKIKDGIYFSSSYDDMDIHMIYKFIKESYWGKRRTFEEQKTALENTMNFGLFYKEKQIAFARVMTDKVFFAYLLDVFVIDKERGKGYSKVLLNQILNFSELKGIHKWMLATKDAHNLYEKFGFELIKSPKMLMEKMNDTANEIYT